MLYCGFLTNSVSFVFVLMLEKCFVTSRESNERFLFHVFSWYNKNFCQNYVSCFICILGYLFNEMTCSLANVRMLECQKVLILGRYWSTQQKQTVFDLCLIWNRFTWSCSRFIAFCFAIQCRVIMLTTGAWLFVRWIKRIGHEIKAQSAGWSCSCTGQSYSSRLLW